MDSEQMFHPMGKEVISPQTHFRLQNYKKYLLHGFKQVSFCVKNVTLQTYMVHHAPQMNFNVHITLPFPSLFPMSDEGFQFLFRYLHNCTMFLL